MKYDALVEIRHRPGIADPEGATIEAALPALGFAEVSGVTVGRAIRLSVDAVDEDAARARIQQLCDALLANPVMEDVSVTMAGGGA